MSDLLPPNATPQERALSEAVARVGGVPVPVRDVWNPDTCPANLLAWLAWAFSVDNWETTWTDQQKREAIKSAIVVHKTKGTIGAVRAALQSLGYGAMVQEWFNQIPEGSPYTFRLLLESDQIGIDQAALAKILEVVETTKNLRSHLDLILPSVVTESRVYVGTVTNTGNEITLIGFQSHILNFNECAIVLAG